MNQCLRCNQACSEISTFCSPCQLSLLQRPYQQYAFPQTVSTLSPPAFQATGSIDEAEYYESGPLSPPLSVGSLKSQHRVPHRIRLTFLVLITLALGALIVDTVFISLAFARLSHSKPADIFPLLTITPSRVAPGQTVQLHLSHFLEASHVLITHDVQELVHIDGIDTIKDGPSPILVQPSGEVDVRVSIEKSWHPGVHYLEAEDVETRYTASAPFEVIGTGTIPLTHLSLSQTTFDMGADQQWANTL